MFDFGLLFGCLFRFAILLLDFGACVVLFVLMTVWLVF